MRQRNHVPKAGAILAPESREVVVKCVGWVVTAWAVGAESVAPTPAGKDLDTRGCAERRPPTLSNELLRDAAAFLRRAAALQAPPAPSDLLLGDSIAGASAVRFVMSTPDQ